MPEMRPTSTWRRARRRTWWRTTRSPTSTLTGTNDAPVAVADTNSGNEDTTITGTVATNDSDVDDGATLSYGLNAAVAGLTLNADGSYSFDAGNAAYQHLAEGATTDVVANYTVTDEHADRHQRRAGRGCRHQLGQRGHHDHRHGRDQRQRRR